MEKKKEQCKGIITYGPWSRFRRCKKTAVKDGFCLTCHPAEKQKRFDKRMEKKAEEGKQKKDAFERLQQLEKLAKGIETKNLCKYVLVLKDKKNG